MEKAPRVFAGNLGHAAVREKGRLHASRLSWHRTPNLRCRPRPLKWAGKPAVQRLGTACAQSAARERSFRDAGKARGSGMTMPLKSKARPLLPRQLHRKLAVANSRGKVFRVTGGRFLAVGGNQLGECQEERGLRQAIAIDAVVMRLRPRLLQTNERQALLFVIRYGAARRRILSRRVHCNHDVAAGCSVPTRAQVSMASADAKSNLEEGLIRELVPLDTPIDPLRDGGKWSVGVARGDLAGDLGALVEIAANGEIGRRRAGAVALLEGAIAAIEACDHLIVALAGRRFGVDQRLRLIAPLLAFVRAANAAQKMQRAEDFGEPLQVVVVGGRRRLGRHLRSRLGLNLRRSSRLKLRLCWRLRPGLDGRLKENLGAGGRRAETKNKPKNDEGSKHRVWCEHSGREDRAASETTRHG